MVLLLLLMNLTSGAAHDATRVVDPLRTCFYSTAYMKPFFISEK
jgi:hypothetical protein